MPLTFHNIITCLGPSPRKALAALLLAASALGAGAREAQDTPLDGATAPPPPAAAVTTAPAAPDSIPEFDRKIDLIQFVPKGQWIAGCSVSYSQSTQDKYQFLIIENLSGETYSFKLSPMLYYAFADNIAIGGRFGYRRNKTHLDKASVVLASDTGYDLENLYSLSQQYSGSVNLRYYLSLGNSRRFGLITEVQAELSGGQSKLVNGRGNDLTGTFEQSFGLDIGFTPGMVMFLNNYSAIEVSVGVLGFSYQHTKSTTDQIYIANRHYKAANFRINLFSIQFGVAFYL